MSKEQNPFLAPDFEKALAALTRGPMTSNQAGVLIRPVDQMAEAVRSLHGERNSTRQALRDVIAACGGQTADDVSTEFLLLAPREVVAAIRKLHARAEQYRQNWLSLQKATGEECHLRALEVIREIPELHNRLRTAKEEDDLTFNRGWNAAKAEITAALGCDWEGIYLAAKEPWALKVAQLVETAKAEGAAEAYEAEAQGWAEQAVRARSTYVDPGPGRMAERRAVEARERAAAIRRGLEAKRDTSKYVKPLPGLRLEELADDDDYDWASPVDMGDQ